jgi:hypothetical protein
LNAGVGDVVGFRWAGQQLDGSAAGVVEAARIGLQDTPPGNAAVAAHVRAADVSPGRVADALVEGKDVVLVWSLRGSPHLVPAADLGVFTAGLRPATDEGWLVSLAGFGTVLGPTGLTATEAVQATVAALPEALDGRELTKRELGAALRPLMPASLQDWFDPQRFTEFTAMLTRAASLTGQLCLTPRAGRREATFALTSQWLGRPLPPVDPAAARAQLLRRYLRCYGPSTPADFAAWCGSAPAEAARAWNDAELVPVDRRWLHAADEDAFAAAAAPPDEIALVAAYDPWLALRDRSTILPDRAQQRQVWRSTGNPGVVLRAGRVVAIWRPAKKGRVLAITVTPFDALSGRDRAQIDEHAQALAPFRAASHAAITYD